MTKKLLIGLPVILGAGLIVASLFLKNSDKSILLPYFEKDPRQKLVQVLQGSGMMASGFPVISGNSLTATVSSVTAIFSLDKDLGVQVRSLQLLLPRTKMEGRKAQEVDLRFNNVVIRYEK